MNKTIYCISLTAISIALVMLLVVAFWLVYPYKTLVFNDAEFSVVTKVVKQGGTLRYVSDYCKYTNLSALVSRTFVNDTIFVTPTTITSREEGCHVISVEVNIPKELPPGEYQLQNIYQYQVNPIRTVVIQHNTEIFTVVE